MNKVHDDKENEVYFQTPRVRGVDLVPGIVISLGSAGAFTALYQVICKFFDKNKDREITIEREGTKITIKGHGLPEERELLNKFAPELIVYRH